MNISDQDSYNPMSNPNLRGIFMKTGNKIGGQYFAELMHIVFARLRSATHDGAQNAFSSDLYTKNNHFTKTGSGQTFLQEEKLRKRGCFGQARAAGLSHGSRSTVKKRLFGASNFVLETS